MWDHLPLDELRDPRTADVPKTGARVSRHGTVSFHRSGFVRVRWDDGRVSDEWAADLVIEEPERQ